jgi:hypothetical protein
MDMSWERMIRVMGWIFHGMDMSWDEQDVVMGIYKSKDLRA